MKLEQLMEGVPYTLVQGSPETEINDIIYDSRKAAPGLLFVCIVGTQRDSHEFAADCAAKGVSALVIQHDIETRDGLWAIRVDPTFYLTTAGLAIDTDCHVLNEEKKAIPGLYAAGDVCGSIEEKDAKQYGMGFDAALTYGYIMGETLKKEI